MVLRYPGSSGAGVHTLAGEKRTGVYHREIKGCKKIPGPRVHRLMAAPVDPDNAARAGQAGGEEALHRLLAL